MAAPKRTEDVRWFRRESQSRSIVEWFLPATATLAELREALAVRDKAIELKLRAPFCLAIRRANHKPPDKAEATRLQLFLEMAHAFAPLGPLLGDNADADADANADGAAVSGRRGRSVSGIASRAGRSGSGSRKAKSAANEAAAEVTAANELTEGAIALRRLQDLDSTRLYAAVAEAAGKQQWQFVHTDAALHGYVSAIGDDAIEYDALTGQYAFSAYVSERHATDALGVPYAAAPLDLSASVPVDAAVVAHVTTAVLGVAAAESLLLLRNEAHARRLIDPILTGLSLTLQSKLFAELSAEGRLGVGTFDFAVIYRERPLLPSTAFAALAPFTLLCIEAKRLKVDGGGQLLAQLEAVLRQRAYAGSDSDSMMAIGAYSTGNEWELCGLQRTDVAVAADAKESAGLSSAAGAGPAAAAVAAAAAPSPAPVPLKWHQRTGKYRRFKMNAEPLHISIDDLQDAGAAVAGLPLAQWAATPGYGRVSAWVTRVISALASAAVTHAPTTCAAALRAALRIEDGDASAAAVAAPSDAEAVPMQPVSTSSAAKPTTAVVAAAAPAAAAALATAAAPATVAPAATNGLRDAAPLITSSLEAAPVLAAHAAAASRLSPPHRMPSLSPPPPAVVAPAPAAGAGAGAAAAAKSPALHAVGQPHARTGGSDDDAVCAVRQLFRQYQQLQQLQQQQQLQQLQQHQQRQQQQLQHQQLLLQHQQQMQRLQQQHMQQVEALTRRIAARSAVGAAAVPPVHGAAATPPPSAAAAALAAAAAAGDAEPITLPGSSDANSAPPGKKRRLDDGTAAAASDNP